MRRLGTLTYHIYHLKTKTNTQKPLNNAENLSNANLRIFLQIFEASNFSRETNKLNFKNCLQGEKFQKNSKKNRGGRYI